MKLLEESRWLWPSTGGFSSGGTDQVGSVGNRDVTPNYMNMGGILIFIGWACNPWDVERIIDETLGKSIDFWLSTGGFISGGAGQVGSVGSQDATPNYMNMGGILIFIEWTCSNWGVEWIIDQTLGKSRWFWLSTGGCSSGGAREIGSVGNRDVYPNYMKLYRYIFFYWLGMWLWSSRIDNRWDFGKK